MFYIEFILYILYKQDILRLCSIAQFYLGFQIKGKNERKNIKIKNDLLDLERGTRTDEKEKKSSSTPIETRYIDYFKKV